jgi:hypothetical protein
VSKSKGRRKSKREEQVSNSNGMNGMNADLERERFLSDRYSSLILFVLKFRFLNTAA